MANNYERLKKALQSSFIFINRCLDYDLMFVIIFAVNTHAIVHIVITNLRTTTSNVAQN